MNKLDLNLLKQSIALAKPYWFSEESRKARWLLVLLVSPPAATAEEQVDARDSVEAVLSFSGSYRDLEFSDMWLQIFRDGRLAWKG